MNHLRVKTQRHQRPIMERILPLFTDKALALAALMVALVFLFILIDMASAEEAPAIKYVLVEKGSALNIREKPEPHASIPFKMERGEALKVYGISADGWAEVSRAGDSGYCRVEFLCDALPDSSAAYTATVDKLRIRALPSGKADTVKKLRKGKQVDVLAFLTCDGIQWARVASGYIMADYLSAEDL